MLRASLHPRLAVLLLLAWAPAASGQSQGQSQSQGAQGVHTAPHPRHHAHPPHRRRPRSRAVPPVAAAPPAAPVPPAPAPPRAAPADTGRNTGLKLPRFAALRADEVNMRSGPGTRYPILWLYKRRDLPVEIEREFDVWRLVEDFQGVKGWVHQATLVGTRSFVVTVAADVTIGGNDRGPGAELRDEPREDAAIVAILRPGVIGRIRECPARSAWCRVTTSQYGGWLQRSAIFGLLPDEVVVPP